MKLFNKFFVLSILIIFSFIVSSNFTKASSICSVTPASGSIAQNGELSFTVSTNAASTNLDLVLISVTNFSNGLYSDIGPGRAIPAGSNSLSFKVHAGNNAETGSKTFKVYCSRDTYVGGSAGGMSPTILDSATVSLSVTGTNPSGGTSGGSGSGGAGNAGSCKVSDISLPPNSSSLLKFELPTGTSIVDGSIDISGTSNNPNITVTPLFPTIHISGGRWSGTSQVIVKTGPNFSGGSYLVTSDINGSKCTAIGNITLPVVTNPSGKLKLTAVKSLNSILFPNSGCVEANMYGTGSGSGCRYGFSKSKIMDFFDSPLLLGSDVMRSSYSRITPAAFSLADPMNPTFSNSGVVTYTDDSVRGEHGMTTGVLVAMSKDGKYSAVTTNYEILAIGTPNKPKTILNSGSLTGSNSMDIVKYNSSYILIHDKGAMNITNPENIEAPLPDGFPDFNSYEFMGSKVVVGDGSYIAVSASDSSGHVSNNDVLLFSVNESQPIAKLTMPAGHERINFWNAVKISFSGGDYIFSFGEKGVNLFKFEYAAKKITWVIKDSSYADYVSKYGSFFNSTFSGFDVGNGNIGIIAFNSTGVHAFLLSDIALGKWTDTLVSSPVPSLNQYGGSDYERVSVGSFSRKGITYVYTETLINPGNHIKVWKFELNTGSSGGTTPPLIQCPTWQIYDTKTSTCITAPPPVPVCTGGALFNTSTGQACTVTTNPLGFYNYYYNPVTGKFEKLLNKPDTTVPVSPNTTPPIYNLGDFILKKGSTGKSVQELQRFLNVKLNLGLLEDGILGSMTVDAIKEWQKMNYLVDDGIVGPKTKALMNAMAN